MSIYELLADVLDTNMAHIIESEASKKLCGGYCIVNGKIVYVANINFTKNLVLDQNNNEIPVKTFDVFLPEAGLYQLETGILVYFEKRPKRQWMKTFNYNYYAVYNVYDGHLIKLNDEHWKSFPKAQKKLIAVGYDGSIYLNKIKIGIVSKGKLLCINKVFKQELIDWNTSCR